MLESNGKVTSRDAHGDTGGINTGNGGTPFFFVQGLSQNREDKTGTRRKPKRPARRKQIDPAGHAFLPQGVTAVRLDSGVPGGNSCALCTVDLDCQNHGFH